MSNDKNSKDIKDMAQKTLSYKIDEVTSSVNNTIKEMFNIDDTSQVYTNEERRKHATKKVINNHKSTFEKLIDHPLHYGGDKPFEVIKVLEAWNLDFHLGNVVKYIYRAGIKDVETEIEDLEKAKWYLQRKINLLKRKK